MSKSRVWFLTIVAAFACVPEAPAQAQLLPLPIKTKHKPTATPGATVTRTPAATATAAVTTTRTAMPVASRTPTPARTPTPVATSSGALPDMVVAISDVQLQLGTTAADGDVAEGCAEATSGVDLLRFSATSRNVGNADLVLGDPQCPLPCSDHPLEVCGNPDYICSPAAGHNHPHYTNYARYELLDRTGGVVVVGHKQGYCLRDTDCASPVYTCTDQGISAGCADTYGSTLGCQYIDVTDVPAGDYVLRVTIDPLNKIAELSDANNVTQQQVSIVRPGGATATPVRTATPIRTSTPVRTTTPAPTVARTATVLRTATPAPGATATPTPVATATAEPLPTASPAPEDGAAAACQSAVLTSGRTLVARALAAIDDCVAAGGACETPRRRTAACRDHASDVCGDAGARLAALRAAFASRVTARCGALADADSILTRRSDDCAGAVGVAAIADCLARAHVCGAGGCVETEEPRAGGRLARGGLAGTDLCIDDLGGFDPTAPELAEAHALDACGRAIRVASRRFVRHRLAALQSCVAAHASCLKAGTARAACDGHAAETCDARKARLVDDPSRLATAVDRACGGIDFGLLRAAGRNLAALAARCTELGVPDLGTLGAYEQCVMRQHACAVDDVLRAEASRAGEWVAGWPAPGGGCPGAAD